jgi:hypothetical protein
MKKIKIKNKKQWQMPPNLEENTTRQSTKTLK